MKRYLFVIFLLAVGSALPAVAQPTQPAQPAAAASKIVMVNTARFFDEKGGITRILTAAKNLSDELAGKRGEIQQMIARVQQVEKDLAVFRDNVAKGIPIDERAAQAKVDELDRLKREGKYKEDEFNSLAQKRQTEVVGPEYSEAIKALSEYIKSKGYGMVFDISKDQNGTLIYAAAQYDITRDFMAFYNARPPTAINSVPK